ncbi:glycosyltransferase [Pedobacter petrophilus]|uniref:Glycosyltransferase n=1 Tax=Pedobacter petrophilus TaxID=1908241 RepID=A0A7K0G327_9SPHI|nr:glycosyltransferase family 2 protein [Pedobacter petrophilus]MRX78208.1 glycosyltransferase [Pedobacter petrophilus]
MAKLGLVTVLYKSDEVLYGFFESLSKQIFSDYHLYIIDNSPSETTDSLLVELISKFPICGVSHIRNENNNGVAKGNNQGIKLALEDGCDYILLLNNDIEFPQENLLGDMYSCAVLEGQDIIIPKIFYYDSRTIWMAGGSISEFKAISSHVGVDEIDIGQYDQSLYFNYAPTCFMLINRTVFDAVGLMDEDYFVYYDDTDFLFRARKKGYKVYYLPKLEVFHKVSSSTGGGETLFSIYYLNRNRIFFILKNLKFPARQISLFYTLATRAVRLLKYKLPERNQLVKAIKDGFNMKNI